VKRVARPRSQELALFIADAPLVAWLRDLL